MLAKLVGGPGDGVKLQVGPDRHFWAWEERGKTTFYLRHPSPTDISPKLNSNAVPVLFFADTMSASEKADAFMLEYSGHRLATDAAFADAAHSSGPPEEAISSSQSTG